MFRQETSIAIPVIAVISLIATVLMGLAGVLSFSAVRSVMVGNLRHHGASLTEHVAAALVHPVWNFDREQIEQIMTSVLDYEGVERISVQLANTPAPSWSKERPAVAGTGARPAGGEFLEERKLVREGAELGTVRIQLTTGRVDAILARYKGWMFAAAVFADLVIVVSLYLTLRTLALKPLQEIATYSAGRPLAANASPLLMQRRFKGELEQVRSSLLDMVEKLERRNHDLLEATRSLEAERSKLEALFRLLPAGIGIVDNDARVLESNPNLQNLLALTKDDFARDRHLTFEYVDPKGRVLSADELPSTRAIRSQSEIKGEELKVLRRDGTTNWISVNAAPLPPYGAVVVVSDISDRRVSQERLEKQLGELERWYQLTLGREARIRQLKAEVNALLRRLGEPSRYQFAELGPAGQDARQGGQR